MLLTVSSWTGEDSQGSVFFELNGIEKIHLTVIFFFFFHQVELMQLREVVQGHQWRDLKKKKKFKIRILWNS